MKKSNAPTNSPIKIVLMVEGATEKAFKPVLVSFLKTRLAGQMPALRPRSFNGGVPTGEPLRRHVQNYLSGKDPADHVIWLTDVYVDRRNPGKGLWRTAQEAKDKAREWVGIESRFHAHVALHDFEAWLLPYWDRITKHAKCSRNPPNGAPETVNHQKPPAYHLNDAYQTGGHKRNYIKTKDPQAILRDQDLMVAIRACPELKALVNTILGLSGGNVID